jgi:hypothetical protein
MKADLLTPATLPPAFVADVLLEDVVVSWCDVGGSPPPLVKWWW